MMQLRITSHTTVSLTSCNCSFKNSLQFFFNCNAVLQVCVKDHHWLYIEWLSQCLLFLTDLTRKVIRILTNARFTVNLIAVCIVLFIVGGFIAFTPKYLETQFFIPAWYANVLLGMYYCTEVLAIPH